MKNVPFFRIYKCDKYSTHYKLVRLHDYPSSFAKLRNPDSNLNPKIFIKGILEIRTLFTQNNKLDSLSQLAVVNWKASSVRTLLRPLLLRGRRPLLLRRDDFVLKGVAVVHSTNILVVDKEIQGHVRSFCMNSHGVHFLVNFVVRTSLID